MQQYLLYGQIAISVLILVFILLQHKGSALGSVFGGESNIYQSKRGLEKFLHWGTIVLTVFFIVTAIANIII